MDVQSAPADVLTPDQRDQIDQFLGNPIKYPSEFKQWLTDYLAVNIPPIPVSQLLGYKPTLAHNVIDNAEIDLDSSDGAERAWHDFGGPAVDNLSDGTYFAAWGAKMGRFGTGSSECRIGPSVNGADPSGFNYATFRGTDPDAMCWKSALLTVKNGKDNNAVTLYYWYNNDSGGVAQFLHRWLTLIRVT